MERREALVAVTALFGTSVFGAQRLLAGLVGPPASGRTLSAADLALLDDVAETILPETPDSPGARAAGVAAFMQEAVNDLYDDDEAATFLAGPEQLRAASRAAHAGREFSELTPEERTALLLSLEDVDPQPKYYVMIKQLTVWGYFTSEIGATQALAHVAVPGRYDGDVAIQPGTKAWSE